MSVKSVLSTIVFGVIFGLLISVKADDGFAPLQGSGGGGSSGPFTKTLQDSYNNGQSIETVGGNAVGFSDLEDDGFTVFNINKSPTTTHAGHAISVSMNAHTTGDGVRVTMANGAAGSAVSAVGGTQTAAAPLYVGTKTWNNSGITFREFKLNVTDTASAAASMFLDFQIAGTSKFSVNKSGALTTTAGTIIPVAAGTFGLAKDAVGGPASFRVYSSSDSVLGAPTNSSYIELFNDDTYTFLRTAKTGTGTARGIFIDAGAGAGRIYIDNSSGGMYTQYGRFGVLPPGSESVRAGYLGIENASDKVYCWYSSSGDLSGTADLYAFRAGSGVLGLAKNAAGAVGTFKLYGTTDSVTGAPTNAEFMCFTYDGSYYALTTGKNGTGSLRPFRINAGTDLLIGGGVGREVTFYDGSNAPCGRIKFENSGQNHIDFHSSAGWIQWGSGSYSSSAGVVACQSNAGIFALHNYTTAVGIKIYNTTDLTTAQAGGAPTDAEWFGITCSSNIFTVGPGKDGAGTFRRAIYVFESAVSDRSGSGSPESAVTANIGSTYHRTDGGAGTSFYVKESGTGNTGWVAK